MNKKIMKKIMFPLSAAIVLLFLQPLASAQTETVVQDGEFLKVGCSCTCNGKILAAATIYKTDAIKGIIAGVITPVTGLTTEAANQVIEAKERCYEQCARSCGGYTSCSSSNTKECNTCCGNEFTNNYKAPTYKLTALSSSKDITEDLREAYRQSCSSTCAYKGMVYGITDIIYSVAGVIGALMIVIHAVKMITAQDASDRNAAKNSIIYVIAALIIIFLAGTLVNMFLTAVPSTGTTGSSESPEDTTTPANGCDSVSVSDCADRGIDSRCMIDSCCYLKNTGSEIVCSKR